MSHTAFYQQSRYYEIAFGYRDVREEVARLVQMYRHHTGRELSSFLELACGPGYHALELARRGVDTIGLDLCEDMVALARERAGEQGLRNARFLIGDMRDFVLAEPVEMAATLLTSLMYLQSDPDLTAHFHAVARNLVPGGIYFIEANDPRDYAGMRYHGSTWRQSDGAITVQAAYGLDQPPIDPQTRLFTSVAEYRVEDLTGSPPVTLRDEGTLRALWPEDLMRLARIGGFEIAGIYGDWSPVQPLDDSDRTWRTIVVLRRR